MQDQPCISCGKRPRRYSDGRCSSCWKREVYRKRPEGNAMSRAGSQRWKDTHREANRARDRQRHIDQRHPCENCGLLCAHDSRRCAGCIAAIAAVRRTLAEGMWADGWKLREMAAVFGGITPAYFNAQRAQGWYLPHRRTPEQVERMRAARWAA